MTETVKPLYDKQITCPLCLMNFTTKRIRTRFVRIKEMESDFFTHYKESNLNPNFYEVSVCPQCGFAFSDAFSKGLTEAAKDKYRSEIFPNWNPRDFSGERTLEEAIETQKLALISGTVKEEKNIVIAGICLRLTWLYRMKNDKRQEERFTKLALNKYKEAYSSSDHQQTSMSDMRLLYLIGELNRRIGNKEEAIKYFSRVIQHKNRSLEQKIVEMAREQWYLTREKSEEEN